MRAHPERIRDKAIEGLLLGKTISDAADFAKMGRRTLHRWVSEDADFRRRLDEARRAVFEVHIAAIAEVTGSAIRRIKQILDNDESSPRDWLRAAALVFNEGRNSEAVEIREMIRQLQDAVEQRP